MKIRHVSLNNRRKEFVVLSYTGITYSFPFVKAEPRPDAEHPVAKVFVDKELANEAITFVLESGEEGSVHIDQVLDYNQDPKYLADQLIYKLTLEARRGMESSGLSRRQVARRLKTSVPQLYRLLDTTNTRKSMNQMVVLLHVVNCEVDVIVRNKAVALN